MNGNFLVQLNYSFFYSSEAVKIRAEWCREPRGLRDQSRSSVPCDWRQASRQRHVVQRHSDGIHGRHRKQQCSGEFSRTIQNPAFLSLEI